MSTTWGSHISSELQTQLRHRENTVSKEIKDEAELLYLDSNTPWIMLRSGVNVVGEGPETARLYRITGGLGANKAGVEIDGIGSTAAYRKSDLGFRAMPGITSVSIKAKDTLGCIYEAQISFKVFSREDLDVVDKVYFKPGFNMLLEWGHTIYLNNSGYVSFANSLGISDDDFFVERGEIKAKDVERKIQERRKSTGGNYDGLLGLVTNFSYDYKSDGSYDCTLTMVSKGAVLEGLQIYATLTPKEEDSKEGDDRTPASSWHTILEALEKVKDSEKSITVQEKPVPEGEEECFYRLGYSRTGISLKSAFTYITNASLSDEVVLVRKKIKVKKWWQIFGGSTECHYYITLSDFLWLSQQINVPKEDTVNSDLKFDVRLDNPYVRPKECVSLNPCVAVLPDYSGKEDSIRTWGEPFTKTHSDTPEMSGIIGDIYVNFNHFCDIITGLIDTEKNSFSFLDALKTLLQDVQKAFGNVNDFKFQTLPDIAYDVFTIVDANHVHVEDTKMPELTITGKKSTVTSISAKSKISDAMVSEMAIAASAGSSGTVGTENSIVKWNEGHIDRFVVEQKENEDSTKPVVNDGESEVLISDLNIYFKKSQVDLFKKKLQNMYVKLNTKVSEHTAEFIPNCDLQLLGEQIYRRLVDRDKKQQTTGVINTQAMPVQLEFTMLGLARFVVGTSFMVNHGIFPTKYDKWAYIITGVEHNIGRTQWTTTLRTQCFPVDMQKEAGVGSNVQTGGSSSEPLPSVSEPSSPQREMCKDCVEAAEKAASIITGTSYTRKCARGTYQVAKNYVQGGTPGFMSDDTKGGNADSTTYWNNLKSLGYSLSYSNLNMSGMELKTRLIGYPFTVGDVVVYRTKGSDLSSDIGKGHTCFFTGNKWVSDCIQGGVLSYSDKRLNSYPVWELRVFSITKGADC